MKYYNTAERYVDIIYIKLEDQPPNFDITCNSIKPKSRHFDYDSARLFITKLILAYRLILSSEAVEFLVNVLVNPTVFMFTSVYNNGGIKTHLKICGGVIEAYLYV